MSDPKNTLFGVDADAAERAIIAVSNMRITTEQAHENFKKCVSSIVNKKTEPTDLENYIKFLEAAKVGHFKRENEHSIFVGSDLGGRGMELFFNLDGSLE